MLTVMVHNQQAYSFKTLGMIILGYIKNIHLLAYGAIFRTVIGFPSLKVLQAILEKTVGCWVSFQGHKTLSPQLVGQVRPPTQATFIWMRLLNHYSLETLAVALITASSV